MAVQACDQVPIFMTKPTVIIVTIFILLLCSCAPQAEPYSPYYFVSAPANATSSPTPFQPSGNSSHSASQTPQPQGAISPQVLPGSSATPFPTITPFPGDQPTPGIITQPQPLVDTQSAITFLLLGSDTRSGSSFRTDTIMIAIVRPSDGQVSLISIPRDLWVNIPTVGMQRINTAYEYGENGDYSGGGAGLLKDTILFNLGIQINYVVLVDFEGFQKSIDTIGGIDVPVVCPYTDWRLLDPTYDPQDENNWFLYTAGPGLLHMDGDLALWYARSRKHSDDFDRGRRQQEVIRAIFSQALRTNLITRIPQLYTDLASSFTTDLGLADILKLSPLVLHLTNANLRSYYIAGDLVTAWTTAGGAAVLLPNIDLIQKMFTQAMNSSPIQQERQKISVEIQNGSPNDGWEALAAERLNYAGYQTSFLPADNRNHATSLLYDLTSNQDKTRKASLLAVLGLPDSALVAVPTTNNKVSYALIVGADYNACFNPASLTP
jgi:LCP family protein required for cell wall assembly